MSRTDPFARPVKRVTIARVIARLKQSEAQIHADWREIAQSLDAAAFDAASEPLQRLQAEVLMLRGTRELLERMLEEPEPAEAPAKAGA